MVAFTDESIRRLRHSSTPQRFRDPQLARHFLVVGPHSKTFFVQVERPKDHGARRTFKVRTGACPENTIAEAREQAAIILRWVSSGENVSAEATKKARPAARTLAECWAEFERHHKTLVEAGDRSPGTLRLYRVVYGKHLASLGGEPMRALADDPERIRQLHNDIAEETPNIANAAMRLLRSIHRHACKSDPALRADWGPTRLIVFKKERVSDDALPLAEMPRWWRQIQDMRERNPIRAAFHAINLLTGSRPEVLSRVSWSDVDVKARTLTLRRTKTRIDVVLPLSMQIVAELRRTRDAGKILYPGNEHVFPAVSGGGHLSQWREPRAVLSHRGYELRRCYRTILREIGADEQSEHLLMGHSAKNVNQRYVARTLLVGSSLRQVQRRASRRIAGLLRG